MKFRFVSIAMIAATFCATPTWAAWGGFANRQAAVPDSKTVKPSNYDVTLTIAYTGDETSGPCTGGTGWADFCPSGDCFCYTFTGTAKGTAGKGPVTLYWTDDFGDGYGSYQSGCDPSYAEIDIGGSKDLEAVAFTGAECGSNFTSEDFLNGGCFLLDTNVYTDGGLIARCGGNIAESGKTKFTIKGKALK